MIEFIESLVNLYIENVYQYKDNFTENDVYDKKVEIENITTTEIANAIHNTRPYPEVIKNMVVTNKTIDINTTEFNDTYSANIYVRVKSTTHDNQVSDIGHNETLQIQRSEKNKFTINGLSYSQSVYYAPYMEDEGDYETNLPTSESVYYDLMMNITPLDNLRYKFNGKTTQNPFTTKDILYSDSYNWLYWLYYYKGIDLGFPLTSQDVLDDSNFKVIFKKGHKYKDDRTNYNEGDLLFFGLNDIHVGIYMGEGKFYTLKGAFPKEDKEPQIYNLDDYWNEFNGRVLRYEHPLYD